MQRTWRPSTLALLGFLALASVRAVAAQDFEAKVPEPPSNFTGTAPVDNGSLVLLKDGRLMMVGSGTRASYSKDGGRTWTLSQPLVNKGEPLSGDGDPTSLIRWKSGKLALRYGRDAKAVGAPPDHLFFRTSADDGQSKTEEKQINVPGVTASPYYDVLTQLESGRLVLPLRWLISGRYPKVKGAGAFATFQGKPFHVEGHARERLGVEPLAIPGGHCPMLPRPEQLAEVLDQCA